MAMEENHAAKISRPKNHVTKNSRLVITLPENHAV
jgi:hypothetical protein